MATEHIRGLAQWWHDQTGTHRGTKISMHDICTKCKNGPPLQACGAWWSEQLLRAGRAGMLAGQGQLQEPIMEEWQHTSARNRGRWWWLCLATQSWRWRALGPRLEVLACKALEGRWASSAAALAALARLLEPTCLELAAEGSAGCSPAPPVLDACLCACNTQGEGMRVGLKLDAESWHVQHCAGSLLMKNVTSKAAQA